MDLLTPTPRSVCSYSIPWNQTDVDSYQTQMYPRFIIGGRRLPVSLILQHYTWLWKELNHRKILMPQEDLCSLFKRCVCLLVKTTACNFVLDSSGLKITAGQRTMTGQKCLLTAFQCDCWRLELKHETMMYRNKFLIVCFTVSVSLSMTGQKQILTELKSS
jgi:hypothetical protein